MLLERLGERICGIPPPSFGRMLHGSPSMAGELRCLPGRSPGRFDALRGVGLGHEKVYVGMTSVAAIADAVDNHPQMGLRDD